MALQFVSSSKHGARFLWRLQFSCYFHRREDEVGADRRNLAALTTHSLSKRRDIAPHQPSGYDPVFLRYEDNVRLMHPAIDTRVPAAVQCNNAIMDNAMISYVSMMDLRATMYDYGCFIIYILFLPGRGCDGHRT